MAWIFKDGIPIYQQIVQIMKVRIASGTYLSGEKIPAVRDLAIEAGVNPNTMQRALSELEREGLVQSERTSGRFVTNDTEVLKNLRDALAIDYIREMAENLKKLGMSPDEIIFAITNYIRGSDGNCISNLPG